MERRRKLLGWIGLIAAMFIAPWVLWMPLRSAWSAGESRNLQCEQGIFDFGTVDTDAVIEHEFVLRNIGKVKVTGLRAMSGCGCISTDLSNPVADTGAAVKAFVRLEVKTLHGAVEMKVYVSGDRGTGRPVTLILRGVVKEQQS